MSYRRHVLSTLLSIWLASHSALVFAEEIINFDESVRSCIAHTASDWGYYGQVSGLLPSGRRAILTPNDWGHRHPSCARGHLAIHRQSPLELPTDLHNDKGRSDVHFGQYRVAPFHIEHNCHTVQATWVGKAVPERRQLQIGERHYRLLQFHIHTPSEHVFASGAQIATTNYPAELHFVHAAVTADGHLDHTHLAVIALFFDLASGPNAIDATGDQALRDMAAAYQGASSPTHDPRTETQDVEIDISRLLQGHQQGYYRYRGSLTTPPCSEIVEWIVLTRPLHIARSTFRLLQEKKLDVGIANVRPAFLPTAAHELKLYQ